MKTTAEIRCKLAQRKSHAAQVIGHTILLSMLLLGVGCKAAPEQTQMLSALDDESDVCEHAAINVMRQPFESVDAAYECRSYLTYVDKDIIPEKYREILSTKLSSCVVEFVDAEQKTRMYYLDRSNELQAYLSFTKDLPDDGKSYTYDGKQKQRVTNANKSEKLLISAYKVPSSQHGKEIILKLAAGERDGEDYNHFRYQSNCVPTDDY